MDVLPAALFMNLKKLFAQTELADVSFLLRDQRKLKSPYEIEQVRKAAGLVTACTRRRFTCCGKA